MCRGFVGASGLSRPKRVVITPTFEEKCHMLKDKFPDMVTIASSNEQLLEESDVVFLGLLPGVARSILPSLSFKKEKLVVSMMAAIDYHETVKLTGMPQERIVRTVPLPSAANRTGPVLIYPPNREIENVLSVVSTPVVCSHESDMKPMIALTGHISSFYELMETSQDFITDQGVEPTVARQFVAAFYSSLARGAEISDVKLEEMAEEAATPGGLNAQVRLAYSLIQNFIAHCMEPAATLSLPNQSWAYLKTTEHFHVHRQSLEAIHNRLLGKK